MSVRRNLVSSQVWISVILIHGPYWLLLLLFKSDLPILSVEILMCLVPWGPWRLRLGVLLVEVVAATVIVFGRLYHFSNPVDVLVGLASLHTLNLNIWTVSLVLLLTLACLSSFILGLRRLVKIPGPPMVVVSAILLGGGLDVFNGSNSLHESGSRYFGFNVIGSPIITVARSFSQTQRIEVEASNSAESAATNAISSRWIGKYTDGVLFYLLVESMGVPTDPWLARQLSSDLETELLGLVPGRRISINTRMSESRGSTVPNEFRLLCGRWVGLSEAPEADKSLCLPRLLQSRGVRTLGMHGFTGAMFERNHWWRDLGLDRVIFEDDWPQELRQHCGSVFEGICDSNVIDLAFRHAASEAGFIYVLSLNTHLPLDREPDGSASDFRQECAARGHPSVVCQLIDMQRRLIRQAVERAAVMPRPVRFVIAGDHPPPFINVNRDAFKKNLVPEFVIEIYPSGDLP